ncbi:electron transport complex subunit RsxG [Aeromonas diversa]|uniref:Ion-translocating oxidoreductase complex subunit G n=1 Tax=Aeromonas diversa CDC 2478-85 TaxID=1268237 RepID=N9TW81_9GAMM|nr:electron transport complex subunit RsxG [Aeromonas diversa]ENY70300.1 RnfABCDGE type electron transport complex subunit G [Aeromonas diversa CDC 2478-85]
MIRSMSKNGLILGGFALVCTAVVALTNQLTAERIEHQHQQEKLSTLSALLPAGTYDNDLVASCRLLTSREFLGSAKPMPLYVAKQGQQISGYALETVAPDGYSGAIRLIVGFTPGGQVTAVRTLAHNETPGLGDKIDLKKSNWIESFRGRVLTRENESRWAVKKDGGDFDAFTGATITPRAVVKAVKRVLELNAHHPDLLETAPLCSEKGE